MVRSCMLASAVLGEGSRHCIGLPWWRRKSCRLNHLTRSYCSCRLCVPGPIFSRTGNGKGTERERNARAGPECVRRAFGQRPVSVRLASGDRPVSGRSASGWRPVGGRLAHGGDDEAIFATMKGRKKAFANRIRECDGKIFFSIQSIFGFIFLFTTGRFS